MLLVQEHNIKLGGIKLYGQMQSIEISEIATIEDITDDKGKTKANQPTGYEGASIIIEFILEDSKTKTTLEQISDMQRLFKPYGQKKARLLKIVNEDCSSRGISTVYFKKLDTKKIISESKRTATLELLAPVVAGIKTKKKSKSTKDNSKLVTNSKKSKSTKSTAKSPSNRIRGTSKAKLKAKKLTK